LAAGAGHIAGGTTANLFAGQSLDNAFANSFKGIGKSMAMGGAIGIGTTIGISYASGRSPWTGEVLASKRGQLSTRFVSTSKGITDLQPTLNRIATGGKFPHIRDGSVFRNAEGLLPKQNAGYYLEFVHPTPSVNGAGAMRIVTGQNGQIWFTPDHYKTFIPIR
jgi:filamentous hemagglutinin